MSYEELYEKLTAIEKELRDGIKSADRLGRAVVKNTESGNLTDLKKLIAQLDETAAQLQRQVNELRNETESFDTRAYVVGGDFTRQLLAACEEAGIDVRGENGVYEMFPNKVRVVGDEEHAEEVWIDRKKVASLRPKAIAAAIREGQDKLYKANFNTASFMGELADAYDMTCLKSGARIGSSQTLTKIYKTMTPMARARKEYNLQAFSFDLARLFESGPETWVTKNGRQFVFGTSRDGKNAIRVLSRTGVESFIITIKSLAADPEDD